MCMLVIMGVAVVMCMLMIMVVFIMRCMLVITAAIIIVIYIPVVVVVVMMNNNGTGIIFMVVMVMTVVVMFMMIVMVVAVTLNLHVSFTATACAAHNPDSCSIYWLRRGFVVRFVTGAWHLITLCRAVNINKILCIQPGELSPGCMHPLLSILVANLRSARFDFAQVNRIFSAQKMIFQI